ncbi:MAG TPA: gamma-glutamyltransferase family protein [Anaerolineales bacterium]|nr:gamma-glutamyltransferase family protein [Anaerolineales bacterium]HRQ91730.1 gamma-glutamyltransferase family protein [Anaerolineales bacterium]
MYFQPNPHFVSRRSPVVGRAGMVASSQPLATAAGLAILRAGGTAADAAVGTAAALNVTEPTSTGIGGDCFALYYEAKTRQVTALNGSGRAPAALSLDLLKQQGMTELPLYHAHTVTVPGAAAGWSDLIARHGRLPLAEVLAPAIELAEAGFPVAPLTSYFWGRGAANQLASAPNGAELLIEGRAPQPGELFRNPGLARTLRVLAEGGARAFYEGEIAEAIVAVLAEAGGVMSAADLAGHHSTWDEPIHAEYRGYRVWECPPNGQGLAALLALNILEHFTLAGQDPLGAERWHLMIEAMRLAFADTRWFVADPATNPAPLQALLSQAYAAERAARLDATRAVADVPRGRPTAGTDTVYLSVVDGQGNACSFINSNYHGFGTGIVPKGWGFTLQNRGYGFSLDASHPNALAPGKRPYHTIIPAMITHADSGELFACYGVMGGYMQPQGHMQVAVNLIDDGLDPQAALDRPRFCIEEGDAGLAVSIEEGVPAATQAQLAQMGHTVREVSGLPRAVFGRGQIILREKETGVLWGGSDPRADGVAMTL